MHDPMSVAWTIKRPWPKKHSLAPTHRYYPVIVTIWHVDPNVHGDDDSCGWFMPRLQPRHFSIIDELVQDDLCQPFFSSPSVRNSGVIVDARYPYRQLPPGDAFALVYAAWSLLAWRIDRRRITARDMSNIADLALAPHDNLRASLVSNEEPTERLVRDFYISICRNYLRAQRPWYRHPRWHIHHWHLRIDALQNLKRWLFSRCAGCGKKFRYGESPTTTQWNGKGPQWFVSESHTYHSECVPLSMSISEESKETA